MLASRLSTALSVPRTPRARLKIVARGFAPLDNLERHVLEYTRVLGSLSESAARRRRLPVVDVHAGAALPQRRRHANALEIRGEPEEPDGD